jgi:hypothetical protein
MPFEGEPSSAIAHQDFLRNPDVSDFLTFCDFLTQPDGQELERLKNLFEPYSLTDSDRHLVDFALATDGSVYESQIDPRIPSTRACFVKVSTVCLDMSSFRTLLDEQSQLVDPFKVARLKDQNNALTIVLPSSNLRLKGEKSTRSTFRKQVETFFFSERTRFDPKDTSTSLAATYASLAVMRKDHHGPPGTVKVHKCPNLDCGAEEHYLTFGKSYECPNCGEPIFLTDSLRLWEEVEDFRSSMEASSRLMNYLEHLLPVHYIRFLLKRLPTILEKSAFFVDNPLAIFGNGAWLHACILRFLHDVQESLKAKSLRPPLVIGLQKTGLLVDFGNLISNTLPLRSCFPITDAFREKYVGAVKSKNGFGSESYYGQDFYVKTGSGKLFVLCLPYPFPAKSGMGFDFDSEKVKRDNYTDLSRACALLEEVETDLWRNALAPIALAHRYTAISLVPSGRILDVLGKSSINQASS